MTEIGQDQDLYRRVVRLAGFERGSFDKPGVGHRHSVVLGTVDQQQRPAVLPGSIHCACVGERVAARGQENGRGQEGEGSGDWSGDLHLRHFFMAANTHEIRLSVRPVAESAIVPAAEMRHNVFLAFKEALHNVVKHSGANEVAVSLATDAGGFQLVVRDNGSGFDPAAVTTRPGRGNGLNNMGQRLEKMGGRCEIHSAPGTGTEIRFVVAVAAERNNL